MPALGNAMVAVPASTVASDAIGTDSLSYGPYDFHETLAREIACLSMTSAFGLDPFPWQQHIVSHLNLMNSDDSGIDPGGVLLVHPTGGGKSLVRDSFAAGVGGQWGYHPGAFRHLSHRRPTLEGRGRHIILSASHNLDNHNLFVPSSTD
eukprot:scaffold52326_cov46-Attheya_sp.AAC.1